MNALTIVAIFVVIIIVFGFVYWRDIYYYQSCPECGDNLNSSRISRQMSVCSRHKLLFTDPPPKNRAIGSAAPTSSQQLFLK